MGRRTAESKKTGGSERCNLRKPERSLVVVRLRLDPVYSTSAGMGKNTNAVLR